MSLRHAAANNLQTAAVCLHTCGNDISDVGLTLDNGEQDDNDKKEKRNIKDDPFDFELVSSRIFDLVTNPATCSHSHVHVEHVTLRRK